jgi:hypothetical protein
VSVLERIPPSQLGPLVRAYGREVRRQGWYLYAIQQGDDGPIKIGRATDPAQRLATLQQGSAVELRGIAAWPALALEEAQLHEEFAAHRLRGEWFSPAPELLELVLALGGCFEDWTR